jgi:hypothetical protein
VPPRTPQEKFIVVGEDNIREDLSLGKGFESGEDRRTGEGMRIGGSLGEKTARPALLRVRERSDLGSTVYRAGSPYLLPSGWCGRSSCRCFVAERGDYSHCCSHHLPPATLLVWTSNASPGRKSQGAWGPTPFLQPSLGLAYPFSGVDAGKRGSGRLVGGLCRRGHA